MAVGRVLKHLISRRDQCTYIHNRIACTFLGHSLYAYFRDGHKALKY